MGILKEMLLSKKYLVNIILAVLAIGTMVFYMVCAGSCSYLKGEILGLDLKYVGIIFMAAVIVASIMKKDLALLIFLSAGIGVEMFLVAFQVRNDVYCPFCLSFGAILIIMFVLNMDLRRKWVAILFIALGLASFLLLFQGSVTPTYS